MFAHKPGFMAVILVAELISSIPSGVMSFCVHTDGTTHYEMTLDSCCNLNDQGQGECASFEEAHPDQADGFTPEDGCKDYSLFFSQVPVNTPATDQLLLGGPERADLIAIVALVPEVLIQELTVSSGFCGPPQDHLSKAPATLVLRI